MGEKRQVVQGMGLKALLDAAALEAIKEHNGAFAIVFDGGQYFVVFGESARRAAPAGMDGHNRLRPALIQALSGDEEDDIPGFDL